MANEPLRYRVSRRGFLKFTGFGLALTALSSCGATATATPPPTAKPSAAAAPSAAASAAAAASTAPQASAAVAAAKPFAGKELNILGPNHHTSNVRDFWVPLFQEKTGAKVNWTEIGSGDVDAKYAVLVASQDSTFDTFYTWETLSAKY